MSPFSHLAAVDALVLDLLPNFDVLAVDDGEVLGGEVGDGGRHALVDDAVGPGDGARPGAAVLAGDLEHVIAAAEDHARDARVKSEIENESVWRGLAERVSVNL